MQRQREKSRQALYEAARRLDQRCSGHGKAARMGGREKDALGWRKFTPESSDGNGFVGVSRAMLALLKAVFLALLLTTFGIVSPPAVQAEAKKIIAHRGGVVGDEFAENSPAALEASVERGYWMIEVDIRETRDGKLVVQHDADFQRFYGHAGQVAAMRWEQIARLRAEPGGSRPLQFRELAALAKGRLRLMLDTKPPEHPIAFFESMERSLRENGLLESAYVIGTPQSRSWFLGKARVGLPLVDLEQAADRGEDVSRRYFLFEHGRDLTCEKVARAQELGVTVVPSINIFHYDDLPDHMTAAEADVRRMLDCGVEEFQIDSPYDVWLRQSGTP